jgi:hypothetical protein
MRLTMLCHFIFSHFRNSNFKKLLNELNYVIALIKNENTFWVALCKIKNIIIMLSAQCEKRCIFNISVDSPFIASTTV